MIKSFIDYPHERKHVHHIYLSNFNLDMFKDVPDDIELRSIEIHDILKV